MAWRLTGQLIETCNCNMFCPCWYAAPEVMVFDQERCLGTIALRVREGEADGVDLAGRSAVITVDFPGPTLFDGNGTARLWIDDGVNPEQRSMLEPILTGQRGGPMGVVAGLMATWLPTKTAAIEIEDDGETIAISVGGGGRIESRRLTDVQGQGLTLRGGGFVAALGLEEAVLAPGMGTTWTDPEFRRIESKSGARGDFAWIG
jgi:hypothetical protein